MPSKDEMIRDQRIESQIIWNKGYRKSEAHFVYPVQRRYVNQLSELADIQNLPEVFDRIGDDTLVGLHSRPTEFRKYKYTIIDDKTFTKAKYED